MVDRFNLLIAEVCADLFSQAIVLLFDGRMDMRAVHTEATALCQCSCAFLQRQFYRLKVACCEQVAIAGGQAH